MFPEVGRVIEQLFQKLASYYQLYWLILASRAGVKVLPENASVTPPYRAVCHEPKIEAQTGTIQ